MKKILIAFLLLFSISSLIYAQGNKIGENIENFKIAYFTKQLELTSDEAKTFWPVYNEFQRELATVQKERRFGIKEAKTTIDELKDKEIETLVDNEMIYRQKELDIEKRYHSRFKSILPIRKVAKLYVAEQGYKRALLKKIQEVRKN